MVEKKSDTMGLVANGFPIELFEEWEVDCKKRFGDCRWLKIWSDHILNKTLSTNNILIIAELERLSNRIKKLEELANKEEKSVNTFAGKQEE